MGEPGVKLPAVMTNKNHARERVGDGEAGGSKGTGGGLAEPQGETRYEEVGRGKGADQPETRATSRDNVRVFMGRRVDDRQQMVAKKNKAGPASFKAGTGQAAVKTRPRRQVSPAMSIDGSDTEAEVDVVGAEADKDSLSSQSDTGYIIEMMDGRKRKRGRGRLPTTGDGILKRKTEEAKLRVRKLREEEKLLKRVLDPEVRPRCTTPEAELVRQMEEMPAEQIGADMMNYADKVVKVAVGSKHLKGTFVKELKESAKGIRAAARALTTKATRLEDGRDRAEMDSLRRKVRSLENQVSELTRKLRAQEKGTSTFTEEARHVALPDEEEEDDFPVLRPRLRGDRRRLEDPPLEDAMENVRRVMEGVSIEAVLTGNPQEVKTKLENLAARCTGVMVGLPSASKAGDANAGALETTPTETTAPDKTPMDKGGKLPTIVSMKVVKEAKDGKTARKTPRDRSRSGAEGKPRTGEISKNARPTATSTSKAAGSENTKQPLPQRQPRGGAPPTYNTPWTEVVRKGRRNKDAKSASQPAPAAAGPERVPKTGTAPPTGKASGGKNGGEARKDTGTRNNGSKRKTPRTAAVSLTFPEGRYEEGLRMIRSKVKLEDIGIEEVRPRRGLTGALILEIPGENAHPKADTLVQRIREVVGTTEGVRVTRPVKLAELRIKDLDDSVSQEEVREAVERAGLCPGQDVRVGPIRRATNGLGAAWTQCPLEAAKRVAALGRLRIGWVSARVDLLEARPLVCYRCLERGHVRAQCRSKVDRSGACYRCGMEGHKSAECSSKPSCIVCKGRGLPDAHKAGGNACPPVSKRAIKRRKQEERRLAVPTQEPRSLMEVEKGKEGSLEWDHSETPRLGGSRRDGAFTRLRALQANLNHARQAQDLFLHTLAERGCGVGIVAEPYNVPNSPNWAVSADGSAAITWRRTGPRHIPWTKVSEGEGWVLVDCDALLIMSVYLRPSLSRAEVEDRLDRMEGEIRRVLPRPILVAGDFNAKSADWGSRRPDTRGTEVADWAARLGLKLENHGGVSTCVRVQGESVIDLTWTSPAAAAWTESWRVLEEVETLSDHLYIETSLTRLTARGAGDPEAGTRVRWAVSKLDRDALLAMLIAANWARPGPMRDVDEEAERLRELLTRACDGSMPRVKFSPRRNAYWWSDAIAELRRASIKNKRTLQRERRRPITRERLEALLTAYRESRVALKQAIRKAKEKAWSDLIEALDEDPWGRPYRLVLKKLSCGAPPTVESLRVEFLDRVVDTLFPVAARRRGTALGEVEDPEEEEPLQEWCEEMAVSGEEVVRAARKLKARKAPGPDGIPGVIWKIATEELEERVKALYTLCLKEQRFPSIWKQSSLVLLRKDGKPEDAPNGYRPICLLDEAGKTLERVIAARLVQHMDSSGHRLSARQFGFREGRSTIDAIRCVKSLSDQVVEEGGVVVAVAVDVANAFNSLPHEVINEALVKFRFPRPLIGIVREYLRDRVITCIDRGGARRSWAAGCGVPQGSVLGPLLWDIAYDEVLDAAVPAGSTTVCYADDTLVLAGGDSWETAAEKANLAVACVVRSIRALGLTVAVNKTEAVYLHNGSHGSPPDTYLRVEGTKIRMGKSIRYLGLQIDGRWRFEDHFAKLAPRLGCVAGALSRLMPNLGGPSWRTRRLYANVLSSIALYGAPVWAEALGRSAKARSILNRAQRRMAVRTIRAYRTISHTAATLLAGSPPIDLAARCHAAAYERVTRLKEGGVPITPGVRRVIRLRLKDEVREEWRARLSEPNRPGKRTVEAILPRLDEWLDRAGAKASFRTTQVLSGHGCFGEYLCRIGRDDDARCRHCDADRDSAQHTLEECPAWEEERRVLSDTIGGDLSLGAVVEALVSEEEAWVAFSVFCEKVISRKEGEERVRRGEVDPPPTQQGGGGAPPRRGRRGGRRGQPAHLRN
ncbi:PREDICTED: uncharacterized protein LOC105555737 [Vollenhovia emeryi]|uniref:uncharacterized protein LOC105555737 n=1 Tax=Vollenhovia emeryi TaxID=411798 RepID=UPI0005F4B106|nr:PREDICTED: uncharacterized protein LOC105555737 [Vollenhovia emeryi]